MTDSGKLLRLEQDGDLRVLTLDDGRGNALSQAMLEALAGALDEALSGSALVLRGREKVFSGGLDLPTVTALNRERLRGFVELFDRVHEQLLAFPRPIVTVAKGSAIAGGAILLCAGDRRLVTPHGKAGITEAMLGLSLPTAALELVRCALGERLASEAAQSGSVFEGEERLRSGFATEVVPLERIDERAFELARSLAAADREAVAALRQQLRADAIERVHRRARHDRERFLDLWFAERTHARLVELARTLAPRP